MIIVMKSDATPDQVDAVCAQLKLLGLLPQEIHAQASTLVKVSAAGGAPVAPVARLTAMPGVARCDINGEAPHRVRRDAQPGPSVVSARGEAIGGGEFAIIAGPR